MPHPFDCHDYPVRPGDLFLNRRPESAGESLYLCEIGPRRFRRGDREGNGADDIELVLHGRCDPAGRITDPLDHGPITYRAPHGVPLFDGYEPLPRVTTGCVRLDPAAWGFASREEMDAAFAEPPCNGSV